MGEKNLLIFAISYHKMIDSKSSDYKYTTTTTAMNVILYIRRKFCISPVMILLVNATVSALAQRSLKDRRIDRMIYNTYTYRILIVYTNNIERIDLTYLPTMLCTFKTILLLLRTTLLAFTQKYYRNKDIHIQKK